MFQYMPIYNDMYNLCLTIIGFLCCFKHFICFVLKLITFTLSKDFDENYNYAKLRDLDVRRYSCNILSLMLYWQHRNLEGRKN